TSPSSCSGRVDRVEAKHCCKTLNGCPAVTTHDRNPTSELPSETKTWIEDYRAVYQLFCQIVLLSKERQNMSCSCHRIGVLLCQFGGHRGQSNSLRAEIG